MRMASVRGKIPFDPNIMCIYIIRKIWLLPVVPANLPCKKRKLNNGILFSFDRIAGQKLICPFSFAKK